MVLVVIGVLVLVVLLILVLIVVPVLVPCSRCGFCGHRRSYAHRSPCGHHRACANRRPSDHRGPLTIVLPVIVVVLVAHMSVELFVYVCVSKTTLHLPFQKTQSLLFLHS